jgi:hypothetical protein
MASGQRYQIGPDDTLVFGRTTITIIPSRTRHHVLRAVLISEVSILGDAP